MKQKLINFALFQIGWFSCVLLGTGSYHWLGPVVVSAIVAYHLSTSSSPHLETRLIIVACVVGLLWENLMTLSGLVHYPRGELLGALAPLWIVAMWALLATTLNISLRWLHGRLSLAAAFGAVGGPLAFAAGERMGAVDFPSLSLAMVVLALGWSLLFALLMEVSRRYDGFVFLDARAGGTAS